MLLQRFAESTDNAVEIQFGFILLFLWRQIFKFVRQRTTLSKFGLKLKCEISLHRKGGKRNQ